MIRLALTLPLFLMSFVIHSQYDYSYKDEYGNFLFKGKCKRSSEPHGKYGKWFIYSTATNNMMAEFYYEDDKKNGLWISYHKNGVVKMKGTLVDDFKSGIWKEYNEEGKLIKQYECIARKSNERGHFLFTEYSSYIGEYKHGKYEYWESDSKSNYTLDDFYKETGLNKDNHIHGKVEHYNKNGEIIGYSHYKNGERLNSIQYDRQGNITHLHDTIAPDGYYEIYWNNYYDKSKMCWFDGRYEIVNSKEECENLTKSYVEDKKGYSFWSTTSMTKKEQLLKKVNSLEDYPEITQKKALYILEHAALENIGTAKYRLAFQYYDGGSLVDRDRVKALGLFKEASDSFYHAAYMYAYMHDKGFGTEQNWNIAFEYYKKTIEQKPDYKIALRQIGEFYFFGFGGANQDVKKAKEYFTKAAKLGDVKAHKNLLTMKFMEKYKNSTTISDDDLQADIAKEAIDFILPKIPNGYFDFKINFEPSDFEPLVLKVGETKKYNTEYSTNSEFIEDAKTFIIVPIKKEYLSEEFVIRDYLVDFSGWNSSPSLLPISGERQIRITNDDSYREIGFLMIQSSFEKPTNLLNSFVLIPMAVAWVK